MPCYDKINVSEGIDISKRSAWKECDIYASLYFLHNEFKSQQPICNKYHDVWWYLRSLAKLLF